MSLLTQAYLLERYGPRLSVEQIAQVLGLSKGTLYNAISAGTLPVRTYCDGGRRYADFRDVAEHIDRCREQAS
jgi:excisionase family DNA binding protein